MGAKKDSRLRLLGRLGGCGEKVHDGQGLLCGVGGVCVCFLSPPDPRTGLQGSKGVIYADSWP